MDVPHISIRHGPQPDRAPGALTEYLCNNCRTWYLKKDPHCPQCGSETPRQDRGARIRALNQHTRQMVEAASR